MRDLLADLAVDPEWLNAFADVERGTFVPEFLVPHPERAGWLPVRAPSAGWHAGVHSAEALITQVDGRTQTGELRGIATSSTSSPRLMALMLDALDVDHGHRVLEIGTGTGYNAALLCHRLGDQNVTSIDVDPDLIDRSRRALAEAGYRPSLHVADGLKGCPSGAPFDRILATVAVPDLPATWGEQLTADGKIVLPLDRHGMGGLLAVFERDGDDFIGHLLEARGYFMPLRAHSFDPAALIAAVDADADARTTDLSLDAVTTPGAPAEHLIALLTGGFGQAEFIPSDTGIQETWLTRPDGSWARLKADPSGSAGHVVSQGGPTRLWDAIERAHQRWDDLGRPDRHAIELRTSRAGLAATAHSAAGVVAL